MTYGIELINSNGLKVVDFEKTLYVKEFGNLVGSSTQYRALVSAAHPTALIMQNPGPRSYATNYIFNPFGGVIETQIPWSGFQVATIGPYLRSFPTMNMAIGDLIFNKIDDYGVYSQWNGFLDLPELPPVRRGTSFINVQSNAGIPFVHASPNPPAGPPSEQYGMQLFDAAGVEMFDSRRPIFSVKYAVLISGPALANVVSTGVALDIPLPVAIPGAYVSAPYMSAYFSITPNSGSNYRLRSAMLKQVAPDLLRVTRETLLDSASPSGVTRNFSQDAFILVGRPL